LYPGAARMLASPGAHLGAVENAVVVGVHLVKSRPGPPAGPFLGALHVLLAGDAAASRGGRVGSGGLWTCLGEGGGGQQRCGEKDRNQNGTHVSRLSIE
jgi:hypothetical protein